MNILLVTDVYFPRINGVSRSIQILRQELHQQGHTTVLVAPDYDNCSTVFFDVKEKILRIPANKIPFDPEDRLMRGSSLTKALLYLQQHAFDFDLIHIHTPFQAHRYGVKWAKKLKIPVIETYHTYFEEYFHCYIPFLPRRLLSFLARSITRSQCKQLDKLIVPSSPVKQVIKSYGISTPVTIIPTGLNNDDFFLGDSLSFKQYFDIEQQRPVIMYVGRIAHEKNIDFLLRVCRDLVQIHPELLFVIAGEGPALKHLVNRSHELKIHRNVRFIGYLSRKKMLRNCYSAADIFVFASRTETQGLVLLEAMAQGTAVVSTAMLGTRDVLHDGEGCLVANENLDDFTRKVSYLLKNPSTREILGQKGRRYAASYSSTVMAEKMLLAYHQLAKTRQQPVSSKVALNPAD